MRALILLLVASVPFYPFGFYLGTSYVSLTYLSMLMVGIGFVITAVTRRAYYSILPRFTSKALWAFFLCAILGLLSSPFGGAAAPKGAVQLVGMVLGLLCAAGVADALRRDRSFILEIVSVSGKVFGVFAAIAIAQFVIWNISSSTFLSFDFLNQIAGGEVWRDGGYIGFLHRSNSFAAEPAHFDRYLGFVLPLALTRLGLVGSQRKIAIRRYFPFWAAASVVIGFGVSISLLGIVQFLITVLAVLLFMKPVSAKALGYMAAIALVLLCTIVAVYFVSGPELQQKLATASLLWDSDANTQADVKTEQISAFAVTANVEVAIESFKHHPFFGGGIGSHGLSYDIYAPAVVFTNDTLYRLNADDAASLFLRLISEQGALGLIALTLAFAGCALLGRSVQLRSLRSRAVSAEEVAFSAFAAALLCVYLTYLIRSGQYYEPLLWTLFGLGLAATRKSDHKRHRL